MSGISTKSVSVGGGSLPKSMSPGNQRAKINELRLFNDKKPDGTIGKGYFIQLDLETAPIGGDFDGWFIDQNNESLGKYLGQTTRIKSSPFAYESKTNSAGKAFDRDVQIIQFLKTLEIELGTQYLDDNDGKFQTIEELVSSFNAAAPFKNVFLNWCLGGSKKMNDKGHPQYFLGIPKFVAGSKYICNDANVASLTKYDAVLHMYDADKPKTVAGFQGTVPPTAPGVTPQPSFVAPSSDDDLFDA